MERRKEDIALIKEYLSGTLSAREMYELERRAQQDPLLMDMMEGMAKEPLQTHETNLNTIDALIKQRIQPNRSPRKLGLIWMAAASLVFTLLVIGFWFIDKPQKEELIADQVNKAILKDTVKPLIQIDTAPLVAAAPSNVPKEHARVKTEAFKAKQRPLDTVKKTARSVTAEVDTSEDLKERLLADKSLGTSLDTDALVVENTTRLAGVVIDEKTKTPLAGAMVRTPSLNRATTTDVQGRFTLEVPEKNEQVEVSHLGYVHRNVPVAGEDSLQIAMVPDHAALDEVVVVGYGAQSKSNRIGAIEVSKQKPAKNIRIRGVTSTAVDAEPIVGWEAYKAYLNKEAAVFDGHTGTVYLVFDLDMDGKPTTFRIKKGGNEALEKRAIDMIKRGSTWKGAIKEVEVEISITFEKPE